MKVPHVIAEIVSEFSGFQHTPDFKASRSIGNFEDDEGEEGSRQSSSTHHHDQGHSGHHPDHHDHTERHGHSLYFGKHSGRNHLPTVSEMEVDAHSESSETSACGSSASLSKEKRHHHGLAAQFKDFFHIGHHHHREHHLSNNEISTPTKPSDGHTGELPNEHNHSIHITVGADELPTFLATPPNEMNNQQHFMKNLSPCISRVASSSSLKEKLEKLNKSRKTISSDCECDIPEKKISVCSYRVVTH